MQKRPKKKKKEKKILMGRFPLRFFISGDKKGGKRKCFFFSVRGKGKCEINNKKKKLFFSPLGIFFDHF